MFDIPLSEPFLNGNEWKYVKECIDTKWVSSSGKFVELFEEKISEYTGSNYAVACVNGTSALQVSLRLSGVLPGDEVIVPSLTFIAPINAILYNDAKPIFMDSDDFYNIDINKTIQFIKNETVIKDGFTFNKFTNKKISAIIPVHIWGNAVWLDELIPLCKERNIAVIEDASESLGSFYKKGEYNEKHTGTLGLLGCFSFNGNKIITSGGGGMIITNDEKLAKKARYLTTQAKDDPIRYIHNEVGYNFRLTNIQAALGVAQLEQLPEFLERKNKLFLNYKNILDDYRNGIEIADVPDYAKNNHWMNLLRIDNKSYGKNPETIIKKMSKIGIETRPVWMLNHLQKPYKNCQNYEITNAITLMDNSLCLPSSVNLSKDDATNLIKEIINE